MEHYDDFLQHYGVKGMKWGKHKRKTSYQIDNASGQRKNTSESQYGPTWIRYFGNERTSDMAGRRLLNDLKTNNHPGLRKNTINTNILNVHKRFRPGSDYVLYEQRERRKSREKDKERAKKYVELYLSSLKR